MYETGPLTCGVIACEIYATYLRLAPPSQAAGCNMFRCKVGRLAVLFCFAAAVAADPSFLGEFILFEYNSASFNYGVAFRSSMFLYAYGSTPY